MKIIASIACLLIVVQLTAQNTRPEIKTKPVAENKVTLNLYNLVCVEQEEEDSLPLFQKEQNYPKLDVSHLLGLEESLKTEKEEAPQ